MKKTEMDTISEQGMDRFFKKSVRSLLLFGLILPFLLKLFIDVPSVALDYICNSYAPFYPTATTVGLVIMQVLVVIADMLRAGFIGCVLCILLYVINKNIGRVRFCVAVAIAAICPAIISFVGVYMTYLCVSVGLSRQTVYEFKAILPDIRTSALIEYALFVLLVVCAVLCLALRNNRSGADKKDIDDKDSFFPSSSLFGTVALSVGFSGIISLIVKILDTFAELQSYQITESFEGIISYLVLPYLYLGISLFAMLCFAAMMYRRMERKWQKCRGDKA